MSDDAVKSKFVSMTVPVKKGTESQLTSIKVELGTSKGEILGRLVDWFCEQDHEIKLVILGLAKASNSPHLIMSILEREIEKNPPPVDLMKLFRAKLLPKK